MKESEFIKRQKALSDEFAKNPEPDDPFDVPTSITINYEGANADGTTKRWTKKHTMVGEQRERISEE